MIRPGTLLLGSLLLLASPAGASSLPFQGTLAFYLDGSSPMKGPVSITGSGVAATNASGTHLTSFTVPAGALSGVGSAVVGTVPPVVALILSADPLLIGSVPDSNAQGTFTPAGGLMGVNGFLKICLFQPGCGIGWVSVPLGSSGGSAGVGLGGPPVAYFNTLVDVGATLQGAPWVASGTFGPSSTLHAFVHGPASGGASSAAQASAVFQYVTPIAIQTTLPDIASATGFGVLTLHFVPEPGTGVLLGLGVAGLATLGWRRRPRQVGAGARPSPSRRRVGRRAGGKNRANRISGERV